MKKPDIRDLFAAPIRNAVLRRFEPRPRRVDGKPMRTEQFAEGTIHYSSYRAAYLEPPPKIGQRRVLNANGEHVTQHYYVPQPWKRVTEKAKRPGKARRMWLAEQRASA